MMMTPHSALLIKIYSLLKPPITLHFIDEQIIHEVETINLFLSDFKIIRKNNKSLRKPFLSRPPILESTWSTTWLNFLNFFTVLNSQHVSMSMGLRLYKVFIRPIQLYSLLFHILKHYHFRERRSENTCLCPILKQPSDFWKDSEILPPRGKKDESESVSKIT